MSNLAISEIVKQVTEIKQKVDKAAYLQKHNSRELRNILKVWYDKNLEFNIPSTAPPYTPSQFPDSHGMLYREARKLKYFVKGFEGDNLATIRREALFIQMLEAVDPEDAKLLIQVISKKPVKGLTVQTINMAFPNMIPVDEQDSKENSEDEQE